MPFLTPIGYYREQIEDALEGKKITRNELAVLLPHIPPLIITQTLGRMCKDGDVESDKSNGIRKAAYSIREHKPVPPSRLVNVDNSELARVWNVVFEKAEYGELSL